MVLVLTVAGCGPDSARPRIIPPNVPAPVTYGALVWNPTGDSLGFFHVPIDSLWYDPYSGGAGYVLVDSLAGWWTISSGGGAPARRLGAILRDADVHYATGRIAYLLYRDGQFTNAVAPLNGTVPDLAAATELGPLGYVPRWSGAGDSLVYAIYSARYISAADGTGYHKVDVGGGPPAWDPTGHAIIGTVWRDSTGRLGSRIVRFDLDTGDSLTLMSTAEFDLRSVQYSPDGAKLSFVTKALSNGERALWVADRDVQHSRRLTDLSVDDLVAWAPDSRRIAVVRYHLKDFTTANSQVWIVDAQTGAAYQLTTGP